MSLANLKEKFPHLVPAVVNAAKNNKISHGILLTYDNNQLVDEFSTFIFQLICCKNKCDNGEPCEACDTCVKISKKKYQDLFILEPNSKSRIIRIGEKSGDEEGSIRWFDSKFYVTALEAAGKKFGIIKEADRMTEEAQNAFLKTLEEPPANSFFILQTTKPYNLLNTIRSRCQQILVLINKTEYNLLDQDKLLGALYHLQFNSQKTLADAEDVSKIFIEMLASFKAEAETEVKPLWEEKIEYSKENLSKADQKRILKSYEDSCYALYLEKRATLLSLIHVWFSQLFILSMADGVLEKLPNPELLKDYDIASINLDDKVALELMDITESLLADLNFNVRDEAFIRNYCISLVMALRNKK